MFGIGMPELLLIMAVALIVIGPKKLPDIAKSMGYAIREFRKATSEFKESLDVREDINQVKKALDVSDIKGTVAKETPLLQKSSVPAAAVIPENPEKTRTDAAPQEIADKASEPSKDSDLQVRSSADPDPVYETDRKKPKEG